MSFRRGDIILRDDLAYPEGALVVDGFDTNQNLLAHPMGGGLQRTIPAAELPRFQITEAFELTSIFRRASLGIEGFIPQRPRESGPNFRQVFDFKEVGARWRRVFEP